jgi:glycosyltransferase involved in cell wall biosynthesis
VDPLLLEPEVPVSESALGSVMFVGRLAAEKNLEKLLEAARGLPETPFVIAGDGPQAELVKQAEAELPNLDYVGWIDPATLRTMLDERCEILVLPSRVEAFGTVAAEAMARARLPLVSDRCGIVDWPELAAGLEVFDAGRSLTPKLRELTQLPVEVRREKRARARAKCLAFVERTVGDWRDTLFEAASR